MVNIYLTTAKYMLLILMAFYTYSSFYALKNSRKFNVNKVYILQTVIIYLMHFIGFTVIYLNVQNDTVILFYGIQVIYFVLTRGFTNIIYDKRVNKVVQNNMCMLLVIGLTILTRLSYTKAVRQFVILVLATIIYLIIPVLIGKVKNLRKLSWVYCVTGLVLLLTVMLIGNVSYGAKLSINLFGFSFQASEIVKMLYVFFLAGFLFEKCNIKKIFVSAIFAGLHIIILVFSRDLGSALIFSIIYLTMVYVATGKAIILFGGLLAGSGAAVLGYKLFSHVRVRVLAYTNPWSVIDNEGYQITQSLFAIGTGGWLGLGLCNGRPNKIPVVEEDFVFSAIAEEMGGFFALCLILLCMSTFMSFIKIASEQTDGFYKLTSLGLAVMYGFQNILTIGGAIKFIPSTGVTLPLISYGGSSLLATMILFGIFQGINGLGGKMYEKEKK